MKNKWLLVALVFFLSGCYPTFKHAVVDPEHNKFDERLIGMWEVDESMRDKEKGEYGFLLFLPCEEGVCITLFTIANDEKGDVLHYQGFAAEVNGVGYINYKDYGSDDETDYELATYQITEDHQLKLALIDSKKLEAAIADKKISGEMTESKDMFGNASSTVVTADREELIKFLSTSDIFNEEKGTYNFKDIGLPNK
ncbi:MAG: hypothetical protein AB7S78_08315 [Candidatus Omnitrophota bacterium]